MQLFAHGPYENSQSNERRDHLPAPTYFLMTLGTASPKAGWTGVLSTRSTKSSPRTCVQPWRTHVPCQLWTASTQSTLSKGSTKSSLRPYVQLWRTNVPCQLWTASTRTTPSNRSIKSSLHPYAQLWWTHVPCQLWAASTRSTPLAPSQTSTSRFERRPRHPY
jgi:hypothetical protein